MGYTTNLLLNEFTDLTDIPQQAVQFSGGGKGQKAYAEKPEWGIALTGHGTSRDAALADLISQFRTAMLNMEKARIAADLEAFEDEADAIAAEEGAAAEVAADEDIDEELAQAKSERATVEDALAVLGLTFPDLEVYEEDDDRTPGPVWQEVDGVPTLVSIVPCVGECMQGSSDICDCRCMGANHGLMKIGELGTPTWAEVLALKPVRFGPKDCACGCGTRTDRRFAPGHDARFHAAQKREKERTALGLSEEEYAEHLKDAAREKAKARRKARRARRAAAVGASEATDA